MKIILILIVALAGPLMAEELPLESARYISIENEIPSCKIAAHPDAVIKTIGNMITLEYLNDSQSKITITKKIPNGLKSEIYIIAEKERLRSSSQDEYEKLTSIELRADKSDKLNDSNGAQQGAASEPLTRPDGL